MRSLLITIDSANLHTRVGLSSYRCGRDDSRFCLNYSQISLYRHTFPNKPDTEMHLRMEKRNCSYVKDDVDISDSCLTLSRPENEALSLASKKRIRQIKGTPAWLSFLWLSSSFCSSAAIIYCFNKPFLNLPILLKFIRFSTKRQRSVLYTRRHGWSHSWTSRCS